MALDPVAQLLGRLDGPRSPRPEFAAALLDCLIDELQREPDSVDARPRRQDEQLIAARDRAPATAFPPLQRHDSQPPTRLAARGRARRALAQFAAAVLLLALVASRFVSGSGWPIGQPEKPLFITAPTAIPATPSPAPGPVAEPVWQADGKPNAVLHLPAGATIDPRGNLWVTDGANGRFVIFSPEGTVLETWGQEGDGEGQFTFKCGVDGYGGVAFDRAGNIYVADAGNQRIQKFSPDRQFLTSWPSQGIVVDSQFLVTGRGNQAAGNEVASCPVDIAIDREGRVIVSDRDARQIVVFAADGRPLATATTASIQPEQLALDGEGNIWVADNSNRVLKFSPSGKLLTAWGGSGSAPQQFLVPMVIAVDDQDRVFVADQSNRVQVFSAEGTLLGGWGSFGSDEGQLFDPVAMALDGLGHVYVVEHFGNRVQKFRLLPPFAPG